MLDLNVYDVIKTESGQSIVKELNANVAILTFENKERSFADLYSSPNEANIVVSKGTCAPVGGTYVKTVYLAF